MLGAYVLDRHEQVSGDHKSACHWGLLKGLLNETGGEEGLPERGRYTQTQEREKPWRYWGDDEPVSRTACAKALWQRGHRELG